MKKEEIFSKIGLSMKDYNEELEKILDNKKFNEEVQNLILSMFYKIESSYRDFQRVKRERIEKDVFISNIIFSIDKYCNNIEIIIPNEKKKHVEYKINKKKGEIKCFPDEVNLLYCIMMLYESNIKSLDFNEIAINEMIKIGNSLNYQEVIRDFNGWAWIKSIKSTQEMHYNLLYQNLALIVGYQKMEEISRNENKLELIKNELEKNFKLNLVDNFLDDILIISMLLKINVDNNYKIQLMNYYEPYVEELRKLSNKEQLIGYIAEQKKNIIREIKKIDKILNNISELKKDFEERNKNLPNSKKILSISSLEEIYEKQRVDFLEKMKEYNKLVEPKEYLKKKEKLEEKTKIYTSLDLKNENTNNIGKIILELQVLFLDFFEHKILNCTAKREIINLVYNFRYYYLLNYKQELKIKDIKKIKRKLKQTLVKLINKAEELKAVELISNNTMENVRIYEKILQREIITLESIVLQIINKNDGTYIQYYDGDVLEGEIEVKPEIINTKKKKFKMLT